jgi:hypothetical protein
MFLCILSMIFVVLSVKYFFIIRLNSTFERELNFIVNNWFFEK